MKKGLVVVAVASTLGGWCESSDPFADLDPIPSTVPPSGVELALPDWREIFECQKRVGLFEKSHGEIDLAERYV